MGGALTQESIGGEAYEVHFMNKELQASAIDGYKGDGNTVLLGGSTPVHSYTAVAAIVDKRPVSCRRCTAEFVESNEEFVAQPTCDSTTKMPFSKKLSLPKTQPPEAKGVCWYNFTMAELQGWLGILVYMRVNQELARCNYWSNSGLLKYRIIPTIMTCKHWKVINRCLHLTDNSTIVRDSKHPQYDKVEKARWFSMHL